MKTRLFFPLAAIFFSAGNAFPATPWEALVGPSLPDVTAIAHDASTGFTLDFSGPPGSYAIEVSGDLSPGSWVAAGTSEIASQATDGLFSDAAAAGLPRRFYRIDGEFSAEAWHLLIPAWTLEWGFGQSPFESRGELIRWLTTFDAALETRDPVAGASLLVTDGSVVLHALRPDAALIEAFGDRFSEHSRLPVLAEASGFSIPLSEGPYESLSGQGTEQARVINVLPLEPGGERLFAISPRRYNGITHGQDPQPFNGVAVEMPVLIRKSVGADAADLDGPWGVVILSGEGYEGFFGPLWFFNIHEARVNVVTAAITAAGADEGTLQVSRERSFRVLQPFDAFLPMDWEFNDENEGFSVPFELSDDGGIRFGDPADDEPIEGHVSPTGALMMLSQASPGAGHGTPGHADEVESELVVAVKRETSPQLAGRSFEVSWLSLMMREGEWDINRVKDGGTLTFDSAGTTAKMEIEFVYDSVNFAGQHDFDEDNPQQLDLDVAVGPDGMVSIGLEDDDFFFDASGFVQVGGGLVVLGVSYQDGEDFETGLMILRELP